jgi:hypothetical protein
MARSSTFKEDIGIKESISIRRGGGDSRTRGPGGAPPIKVSHNVEITLRERPHGRIVQRRKKHNIFLNYGREWLAELIALNTFSTPFRSDRIRYMGYGIGGTSQLLSVPTIQALYPGWAGYTTPVQTDTDPTVTGLEYPVEVLASDYYDDVSQPATFPAAGIVRFTSVVGYNEISYPGGPTSVPLSEIGLFTESVPSQATPPLSAPPERYMVAYNTFDTLSKTSAYVLQIDWELRFS